MDELLPSILDLARNLIGAEGCAIWRFDERGASYKIVCSLGLSAGYVRIGIPAGFVNPKLNEVLCVEDIHSDPRVAKRRSLYESEGIESMLVLPVPDRDRVTGTLALYYRNAHKFPESECKLAEALARLAASAIQNNDLIHQQERMRLEAERSSAALEAALSALRENEEHLIMALEAGRMGIWDWDIATNALHWTDTLVAMHGFPPGGFDGTFEQFVSVIHADDRPAFLTSLERAMSQKAYYENEFRVVFPDGGIHWIAGKGKVICDDAGKPVRMIGLGMDVTERRLLEDKLRKSQKLESIGLLAGGIAHDFNNLLTGIMGNAALAAEVLPNNTPAAPFLTHLLQASERAAALTQQLLAYSGKGRFVVRALNLSGLVREISGLVRSSIPKLIRLEFDLATGLPPIHADPSQAQQIVMNLTTNAAEAIGEQGGRILLKTGSQTLTIEQIRTLSLPEDVAPGSYVYLEVQDTGCGMDAEMQARIFDPFFTTKFTGRGLGLAAVSGIVHGHRGAIQVFSAKGQGSVFRVLIPAAAAATGDDAGLTGAGLLLLVGDDDARGPAASGLRRYGYRVVTAKNGIDALVAFGQAPADFAAVIAQDEIVDLLRGLRSDVPAIVATVLDADALARKLHSILPKVRQASNGPE